MTPGEGSEELADRPVGELLKQLSETSTLVRQEMENPLPLAVGGALVVGFLLGRRGR